MGEYKKPYLILFGAFADAVEFLEKGANAAAKDALIEAMQKAEDAFLDQE